MVPWPAPLLHALHSPSLCPAPCSHPRVRDAAASLMGHWRELDPGMTRKGLPPPPPPPRQGHGPSGPASGAVHLQQLQGAQGPPGSGHQMWQLQNHEQAALLAGSIPLQQTEGPRQGSAEQQSSLQGSTG